MVYQTVRQACGKSMQQKPLCRYNNAGNKTINAFILMDHVLVVTKAYSDGTNLDYTCTVYILNLATVG